MYPIKVSGARTIRNCFSAWHSYVFMIHVGHGVQRVPEKRCVKAR